MINFFEWKIFNLFENEEGVVSGPGVDLLQKTMREMANRGAPTEDDLSGFGKQDWVAYSSLNAAGYLSEKSIPIRIASQMLRILSKYRNTQIKNYQEISDAIYQDINREQSGTFSQSKDKVKVFDNQPLVYGKVKIYIPHGIDRSMTIAINRIVDTAFEEEGAKKERDKFGNFGFPRFKKFQADKNSINSYYVHTRILSQVLDFLKSKEFEIETESKKTLPSDRGEETSGSETPIPIESTPENEIEILGVEKNQFGNKLAIKFNLSFEKGKEVWSYIKNLNLTPKFAAYAGQSKFLINIDDKQGFENVKNAIKSKNVDVKPLEDFMDSHFKNSEENQANDEKSQSISSSQKPQALDNSQNIMSFSDAGGRKMKIKVNYSALSQGKKVFLKEAIQYTFPEYEWQKSDYSYIVSGSYKQYVTFGRLLKKFGYLVDDLRSVFEEKVQRGDLEKSRIEGKHDKDESFLNSIEEKLPDSSFDLYDAQKKGIAFLYGRDHAILGDETGLGKTVQLVAAAALRMKENNLPTLIVTLKPVVKQWISTITSVLGDEAEQDVSTDGLNPKKWTVLYYNNFSSGKNLKEIVDKLANTNFGVVILDELHKIKHSKATWSKNMAEVVKNIPTRWGASATVSSNKPMDVRNQLKITGHHLGDVDERKFKKDFAGEDMYDNSGLDNQGKQLAAAERLNRWLNLSGVYVRRSKQDVRDMPNITVWDHSTSVDQNQFDSKYQQKLSGYKNPSLPVSKLIAARETVAQLKTDETARMVMQTVKNGLKQDNPAASKIVVFTNFVEAGDQLVYKITQQLKNIDPNFYVLTYLSNTKKKDRLNVKTKFTDDPNAKVLVMSMKMGGTGIDFPNAAQNMIINDFDWTPESAEQSEGRIYRINTNHPVDIKYNVAHGIDKKLFEKVKQKRKIASIIQQYRKDYQEAEHDPELLNKIIEKQRELAKLDDDMIDIINSELPGAGDAFKESFKDFVRNDQLLREELLYGFSLGFNL